MDSSTRRVVDDAGEVDYRERLIRKIKAKTGREPDLSQIEDTLLKWVRKMEDKQRNEGEKDAGEEISGMEHWRPAEGVLPQGYKMWSLDELEALNSRRAEVTRRTVDPFDRAKWIAKSGKGSGPSPVDIRVASVKRCWLRPLTLQGVFDGDRGARIENSGHTMKVTLDKPAYLLDGPLFGKYKLDHVHFHWSENGNSGTEHAIDGKRYATEAHFFFKPDSCKGYRSAVRNHHCKHHCVIALLFKEVKNAPWYETFSYCSQVTEANKHILVDGNCLRDFKPAFAGSEFYNYNGALTTPPYTENFEWIVLKRIMPIQKQQVDCLRALRNHHKHLIGNNVKDLEPLGKRIVIANINRPGQVFCTGHEIEECACEF